MKRRAEDRIRFRVGINLGDIVVGGDDILGDGVNMAARLEMLAEPGEVCVSENGRGSDPGYTRNVESLDWRGSGHFRCNP